MPSSPCGRLAVGAAVVLLALSGSGTCARAELHFTEIVADAGEVRSGPVLSYRFAFTNTGPDPVEIFDLRTTCGCLSPQLAQRDYQPGETGTLLLEVNTLTQPPGPHAWRVQVFFRSASKEQDIPLQLNARLVTEVTVQPAALNVVTEHAVSHELVLTDLRPHPLTITAVRPTSPRLTARLGEAGQDAQGHWTRRIHLEVPEDYPEGRHEEAVVIYSDDLAYRELKVPVTLVKRARQALFAAPAQVQVQGQAGQPIPSRIVLIRAADDQGVVVERVTADDPAIACQWAQGPSTSATVKLTIDRNRLHGNQLQSAVHVQVTKPVPQSLTIPVSCNVQ
jgi:hypothetical protein